MAILQTMYPGVANSPDTFLVEGLTVDGTVMYVADGAVFGEIPTLAVIGLTDLAETVQITGKQSDGGYTIIRGVEGKRQAWAKATNVARNWTNKDYEALRSNVTAINAEVGTKVDKVTGKGLSTNDYDDTAKKKVDGIPDNPKYTDTVPDLSPYAKKADVPTKLSQLTEDSTHRLITDAEKAKVRAIPDDPKYTDTIPDLTPYAKKADIKTRLADMEEDSEHRTMTDEEKKALDGKVDKVSGKGLSTNDYDDVAKTKVDAIPANPKYTDTVPDLSPYAKKADAPTKQLLYDIFMGESLVTKKEGEWPVVHGKSTGIGANAFKDNQLTSVVIPPSVTSIGNSAFEYNQLTSIVIPSSVTSIGKYAFNGNKLTSAVIPPSVTSIGNNAFNKNKLTSVTIPPSVTSIGERAFSDNQLTNIVIPPSVTSIESGIFEDNKLIEVTIPSSVTSIGKYAFKGNQLMSVVIPPSVTSIGERAFGWNELTSVIIPSSVTSIGDDAFYRNKLTEVKVPKNCTVGNDAFDWGVNIIRY